MFKMRDIVCKISSREWKEKLSIIRIQIQMMICRWIKYDSIERIGYKMKRRGSSTWNHTNYSISKQSVAFRKMASSLVTLNSPCNNSRLTITNRSFHLTAPALWNSLPPDLRYFSSHSTSQPNLNSPIFSLSSSVFLKKLKTHLFRYSFPP
jgi:hypothetical protein